MNNKKILPIALIVIFAIGVLIFGITKENNNKTLIDDAWTNLKAEGNIGLIASKSGAKIKRVTITHDEVTFYHIPTKYKGVIAYRVAFTPKKPYVHHFYAIVNKHGNILGQSEKVPR
jgi:hypothetical protein